MTARQPGDGVRAAGFGRWAVASLGIALLSYVALVIEWTGMLRASCGTWNLDCAAYGVRALALGCTLGTFAALASFGTRRQRWLSWLGLVLNGVPALTCGLLILWFLGGR